MGWNGNAGEIRSRPPTKQFREGFERINWAITTAKTESTMPTPEHLKDTIYDDDGVTHLESVRGRGPHINVKP